MRLRIRIVDKDKKGTCWEDIEVGNTLWKYIDTEGLDAVPREEALLLGQRQHEYLNLLPLTEEQRERLEAGVLPKAELSAAVRAYEFRPEVIGGLQIQPRLRSLPCTCGEPGCDMDWSCEALGELTAQQWAARKRVIAVFPESKSCRVDVVRVSGSRLSSPTLKRRDALSARACG